MALPLQHVQAGEPADKSIVRLLCMSIGFFAIQYGWAVQYSQMSTFLESLGSVAALTALIWCAGPITGTLAQPILAAISDRTWTRLGSRRPYLLAGAILSSLCMVLMPNSMTIAKMLHVHPLLVAGILLWCWDISINTCQGPIRWLVVDTVNKKQQALTFALMGFALAIGASFCFFLGSIVPSVHFLFYFGAVAMLVAMGWTILSSPEQRRNSSATVKSEPFGIAQLSKDIVRSIIDMHPEAKKLCFVNSLTWFGAQCMFVFLPLFIAHNIFVTHDPTSPIYTASRQLTSTAWLGYYLVCLCFSLVINRLLKHFSMKSVHTFGLLCMGCALFGLSFSTSTTQVVTYMSIAGVGWATTMAIPFAWAARYSSEGKGGACLSVFNTYLAFSSFLANLVSGWLVTITRNDVSALMLAGGVALLSALLLLGVKETPTELATSDTPELPEALPAT